MISLNLKRNLKEKMLAGVCAGLADKFQVDVLLVRLAFVLSVFFVFGLGILIYLILWALTPVAP